MARFLAGAAACFLLLTAAFFLWQSHAEQGTSLPAAPPPRPGTSLLANGPAALDAPEASPKDREERRFSRADKNKDGRIESEEILGPRRKAFSKLDANGNGSLSFDEWAASTIEKIQGADKDRSGWLSAGEYATTAPPPPKHKRCAC